MASFLTGGGDAPAIAEAGPNGEVIAYMRCVGTIAGGSIAGVLGLTGGTGALFYLIVSIGVSLSLLLKTGVRPTRYFRRPFSTICLGGVFERTALLSYLLFWTFFYAFR